MAQGSYIAIGAKTGSFSLLLFHCYSLPLKKASLFHLSQVMNWRLSALRMFLDHKRSYPWETCWILVFLPPRSTESELCIWGLSWWSRDFLGDSVVKNPPANVDDLGFEPWVRKIPWRRKQQPTPVFLPTTPLKLISPFLLHF